MGLYQIQSWVPSGRLIISSIQAIRTSYVSGSYNLTDLWLRACLFANFPSLVDLNITTTLITQVNENKTYLLKEKTGISNNNEKKTHNYVKTLNRKTIE